MDKDNNLMEKIVALCKRRGFIYPGSEIYGGLAGTWDLGPLGVELARNIKQEWWRSMVYLRDDIVGLDSSILHHPQVWEASGHVASFTDPLVECKVCHLRFRADHKKEIEEHEKSHEKPEWTGVKQFNLMFKTYVGPTEDDENKTYLRPETAQGIFINFLNVLDTTRVKIPFGIAQIGKGFRNEITTGNFLFRAREFEIMELEFFVKPGTDKEWHEYWKKERLNWYLNLGIKQENIKIVDLPREELAHYSRGTAEIWYNWPFMGFGELEGIANRGDYDLKQHSQHSGKKLEVADPTTPASDNQNAQVFETPMPPYTPYVVEPAVGVGRAMLAFLLDAYSEGEGRVILKLHPKLAPYKVAVFPLLANKSELTKLAREIYEDLKEEFMIAWDDRGNIGKRYASQDEIGTPFCITVDFDTLKDNAVTVRNRDSAKQERVKINELSNFLQEKLK